MKNEEIKSIICRTVKRKNINSTGDFEVLKTDSAKLVHTFKKSDAGVYSNQQLDITAVVEPELSKDLQSVPQLFELTDSDGNVFEWGDIGYRARCNSCVREGKHNRITFERNSPNFEI